MLADELHEDPGLDQALRSLVPPIQRSRTWERERRAELMAYIASGNIAAPAEHIIEEAAVGYLRQEAPTARRRSIGRALATAATVALLLGTLALTTRSNDDTGPNPRSASTEPVPSTVPSLAPSPLRPDRFPMLPASDPRASLTTAMDGGQMGWNNPTGAQALVAKVSGDSMTEAVNLSVVASLDTSLLVPPSDYPGPPIPLPEAITIAGVVMTIYPTPGSPDVKSVVAPGNPTLVAYGRNAVAFLQAAGGFPIVGPRIDSEGEVTFELGRLPDTFEVVIPPRRLPLGSISASTNAPDGDDGDGITVFVAVDGPLVGLAPSQDLHRVDINGAEGWMGTPGPGAALLWPVSETTWAAVAGASTADAALEFARAVTFVDEATWRERYHVAEPDYGTKEEATRAPRPTIPDPTEMIIGHRTAPDEPIPTPVGCPNRLPTDNPVPSPIAATEPFMALTAFLAGPNGSFLLKLGYEEVAISSDRYRYDVRNNTGDLVTVVIVDSINGKWAATRWLSSPC
jgi:hypothetical protein